jgi:hypothetical protein
VTREEAIAKFAVITDGCLGDADDFAKLDPDEMAQAVWNYAHMDASKAANLGDELLSLLPVLGVLASDVTGFAGAYAALRAL